MCDVEMEDGAGDGTKTLSTRVQDDGWVILRRGTRKDYTSHLGHEGIKTFDQRMVLGIDEVEVGLGYVHPEKDEEADSEWCVD